MRTAKITCSAQAGKPLDPAICRGCSQYAEDLGGQFPMYQCGKNRLPLSAVEFQSAMEWALQGMPMKVSTEKARR